MKNPIHRAGKEMQAWHRESSSSGGNARLLTRQGDLQLHPLVLAIVQRLRTPSRHSLQDGPSLRHFARRKWAGQQAA